jgi:hypothetical protein
MDKDYYMHTHSCARTCVGAKMPAPSSNPACWLFRQQQAFQTPRHLHGHVHNKKHSSSHVGLRRGGDRKEEGKA